MHWNTVTSNDEQHFSARKLGLPNRENATPKKFGNLQRVLFWCTKSKMVSLFDRLPFSCNIFSSLLSLFSQMLHSCWSTYNINTTLTFPSHLYFIITHSNQNVKVIGPNVFFNSPQHEDPRSLLTVCDVARYYSIFVWRKGGKVLPMRKWKKGERESSSFGVGVRFPITPFLSQATLHYIISWYHEVFYRQIKMHKKYALWYLILNANQMRKSMGGNLFWILIILTFRRD